MPTYTTDDQVKIAYRVEGSEGGRNVLFVHGWMMNGHVYDDLLARLDTSALRCVIPDQRGAGESDKPESGYSIARYAADIIGLIAELSLDRVVLVAHSMGGQIAQMVAAKIPDQIAGVVLINTVPASGIPLPEDAQGLFRGAASREPQATILGMACKELDEASTERLLGLGATVSAPCIAESFDAWMNGGFADQLKSITAPTLVIATDDPFLPHDFLRAAVVGPIANARMAIIAGPGHYPQVERPAETAAVVEGFFAGLGLGAAAAQSAS
jgi:pimeloyl-ACP methyl ester carboxylesterase